MGAFDSYLELGLTALGRGGQQDWFNGHFGAALLAAYYTDKENDLPEHVREGLIRTCESYRTKHPDWFVAFENEPAQPERLEKVIAGLRTNTERLTSSGHGLALGVLGLKGLLERPDLCTPSIVDGIAKMLELTAVDRVNRYYGVEDYFQVTAEQVTGIAPYETVSDLVRAAFAALEVVVPNNRIDGHYYFFTGEVEHGLTHAHAIVELDRLGYHDLAQKAMHNHRIQIYLNTKQAAAFQENAIEEPPFTAISSPLYWTKTYGDPHAIKVPYATLPLLNYLPESERVAAEANTCKILCQVE